MGGFPPTLLVGRLWLFVGGRTHFVPWWAVVVGGCTPRRSWVLTGGKLSSFVGGWCESHPVSKPTKNPAKPGNPCHWYGLGWGYKYPTHTRTRHHPRCQPAWVYKPVTFPRREKGNGYASGLGLGDPWHCLCPGMPWQAVPQV
jgi:hypothetical protein